MLPKIKIPEPKRATKPKKTGTAALWMHQRAAQAHQAATVTGAGCVRARAYAG